MTICVISLMTDVLMSLTSANDVSIRRARVLCCPVKTRRVDAAARTPSASATTRATSHPGPGRPTHTCCAAPRRRLLCASEHVHRIPFPVPWHGHSVIATHGHSRYTAPQHLCLTHARRAAHNTHSHTHAHQRGYRLNVLTVHTACRALLVIAARSSRRPLCAQGQVRDGTAGSSGSLAFTHTHKHAGRNHHIDSTL